MKNPMEKNYAVDNSMPGHKKNVEIKKKGFIKLGFDWKDAGMGSREDVVAHLDEKQLNWEKANPGFKATETRDDIQSFKHIGIGGTYWSGYRYFKKTPRSSSSENVT